MIALDEHMGFLAQGEALADSLSDADFPSIGPHLRHAIEHYDLLFAGLASGCVDYDARAREARLETDRTAAAAALARIRARLASLAAEDPDRALRVGEGLRSSLGRELHYLLGHTVHHYALAAQILRARGLPVADDFGVAPSTLRHRNAACAR